MCNCNHFTFLLLICSNVNNGISCKLITNLARFGSFLCFNFMLSNPNSEREKKMMPIVFFTRYEKKTHWLVCISRTF
ncbi:hypothetical protein IHE45_17G033400 [Dioscorea alata]|uniref:Uncharacterized protein n=1 Tax=Dioscorea alata TaxID=55571 RepID=A0ACB7UBD5_DIOAL|nr:hypothetical protein IHE45_17G033400 [Dioscorea alata]